MDAWETGAQALKLIDITFLVAFVCGNELPCQRSVLSAITILF